MPSFLYLPAIRLEIEESANSNLSIGFTRVTLSSNFVGILFFRYSRTRKSGRKPLCLSGVLILPPSLLVFSFPRPCDLFSPFLPDRVWPMIMSALTRRETDRHKQRQNICIYISRSIYIHDIYRLEWCQAKMKAGQEARASEPSNHFGKRRRFILIHQTQLERQKRRPVIMTYVRESLCGC